MNISKQEFDRLKGVEQDREEQRDLRRASSARADVLHRALDKIVKAANGQSITEERGFYENGWATSFPPAHVDRPQEMTDQDRQDMRLLFLNERITELEKRLATVRALALFAKEQR